MSYQITFDPDGDDLGRAKIRTNSPLEFQIIVPHVAHILECLHLSELSKLPFKYAFEFPVYMKNEILLVISTLHLPLHVNFYECNGNKLFEMRGASGGITSGLICYLVTKD